MAFPPLSQGPFGLPQPQGADPPGYYYYGWPLAGAGKRLGLAFIDYVLVWFALLIVIGLIGRGAATAQGGKIGSLTAFWLFVVAYAAQCWNFIVRQGRSGQSFGKQLRGPGSSPRPTWPPPAKPPASRATSPYSSMWACSVSASSPSPSASAAPASATAWPALW